MPRVTNTALIRRPTVEVFDFVTTPRNWPAWHPSSLAVSGTTAHSLRLSETVTEDVLVAGRRGRVVWTVVKREAPERWSISGRADGGGRGVLTYVLKPHAEGTLFEREFVYTPPSLFYVLLDKLFFHRRLRHESTRALQNLQELLERRTRG